MSIKPESSWWAGKEAMAVEFVSTLQDLLHKNKDLEINMVLLGFASRSARPVQPDFRISHLMPLLMVINPPSHFCANYPNPSVSQNNKAKLQRRRGIPPLNPKQRLRSSRGKEAGRSRSPPIAAGGISTLPLLCPVLYCMVLLDQT